MDRRSFIARIMGGAAAAIAAGTFDLDKALWVPGATTIFVPAEKKLLQIHPGAALTPAMLYNMAADRYDWAVTEEMLLKAGYPPALEFVPHTITRKD